MTVVDDRERFANRERFPDAENVIVDSIPDWIDRTPLSSAAYVVVLTRGHRQDYEAVRDDGATFLLVPGHEDDRVESVVEREDGHSVVEKRQSDVRQIAVELDPRAA